MSLTVNPTKNRILNTALDLFHTNGFQGISVSHICQQAGVKKGSFYYFFPSKRALLLKVIEYKHQELSNLFQGVRAESVTPATKINRIFEAVADYQDAFLRVPGCPLVNLVREHIGQMEDENINRVLRGALDSLENHIAGIVKELNDTGEYGDLNITASAHNIFLFLQGSILMAQVKNDTNHIRESGAEALKLLHRRKGGGSEHG